MLRTIIGATLSIVIISFTFSSCRELSRSSSGSFSETRYYRIEVKHIGVASFLSMIDSRLDPYNNKAKGIMDSLVNVTKTESTKLFEDIPDSIRPNGKYELFATDTLYNATMSLISGRVKAYMYTLGANGMTRFYAINYLPRYKKFLSNEEIFDMSKEKEINEVLAKHFHKEERTFFELPTIKTASAINLSKDSVIFAYEHYVIGPRSIGIVELVIPLDELEDYMLL